MSGYKSRISVTQSGSGPLLEQAGVWEVDRDMTWLQVEGDKVYAAHEVDSYEGVPGGAISRWKMTKTGLKKMESISLPTESPAHLLVSLEHGLAFEANYHGHTWTAVRMDDGRLGGISYQTTSCWMSR